jgi:hypothetical protein
MESALDEASGESFPDLGVGVNNGGVFGRRDPPWWHLLGCFLLGPCLPGENLSPVSQRGNDGGFGVVFLLEGVALEDMGPSLQMVLARRALEDLE